MADIICKCDEPGLSSLGIINCVPHYGTTSRFGFTPVRNGLGAKNFIDGTKELNDICLDEIFANADATQRVSLTPTVENFVKAFEDDVKETFDSGNECFVRKGKRSVTAELITEAPYELAAKINSIGCQTVAAYEFSDCGAIRGICEGTNLYPYKIKNLRATPQDKTGSTCAKVLLSFDIDQSVADASVGHIYPDSITGDLDGASALIELSPVVENITTTSIDLKLNTCFGSCGNKIKYEDLTAGDFTQFENVTATVDLLGELVVTETAEGCFTITWTTSATSGDVINLALDNLLPKGYVSPSVTVLIP